MGQESDTQQSDEPQSDGPRKQAEYAPEVTARLRRLHERASPGDADDLVQDAYVRLLSSDRAQLGDPVRYLFGIARNLVIDRFRARRAEERVVDVHADAAIVAESAAEPGADPERALLAKDGLARALAEIDRLPPRCGQAFRLHRFEELTYAEIARRMGISVSAVEKHIADAMLRLRRVARDDESDLRNARGGSSS